MILLIIRYLVCFCEGSRNNTNSNHCISSRNKYVIIIAKRFHCTANVFRIFVLVNIRRATNKFVNWRNQCVYYFRWRIIIDFMLCLTKLSRSKMVFFQSIYSC